MNRWRVEDKKRKVRKNARREERRKSVKRAGARRRLERNVKRDCYCKGAPDGLTVCARAAALPTLQQRERFGCVGLMCVCVIPSADTPLPIFYVAFL